jgi:hypothetical protein
MEKFEIPQIQAEILQSWPFEARQYIGVLQTYLQNLQTEVAELQAQLAQNSQNSSKPPSSDPPFKRPPKKTNAKQKSEKAKGGQVGHTRHSRELLPVEAVAEIVEIYPSECEECHAPLHPSDQTGQMVRHQVWELPKVKATVTEYQFYACQCYQCSQLTKSEKDWPKDVPTGQFGPHLVATLGVLHGQYQLSVRQTQQLAFDLWELPLSLGGVSKSCQKVSNALTTSYHLIEEKVQNQPTNHVDETGWKREGGLRWLWTATNGVASLFKISDNRAGQSLKELLGENYPGIIHSDRHKPYLKLAATRHQLCWAHLIRNLRGLSQRAGPAEPWAEESLRESEKLFEVWQRFKRGEIERVQLHGEVGPIRAAFKKQLQAGTTLGDGKVRAFSRELLKLEERLYLFVYVKEPGVEPTNNAAEQALRCAVIWRKKCFGNQSDWGERFVERVLSVRATVQKQGLNFLHYLTTCLEAEWFATPAPTLFATP